MASVDLHLHSTASDGQYPPADVVRRAAETGLTAISLTDHDTIAGVSEAVETGNRLGVRVVRGCELSVAAPWGELHLLAYFLPGNDPVFSGFLSEQRAMRAARADEIFRRLRDQGVALDPSSIKKDIPGMSVGRPHVAEELVRQHHVADMQEAFDRYLGNGRPAFVAKRLPDLQPVSAMIKVLGGVTSAAHLGTRATRQRVRQLARLGVDAVEVLHPSHDAETVTRLATWASEFRLLRTGGSDWHGEAVSGTDRALGSPSVPHAWLEEIEQRHDERVDVREATA